MRLNTWKRLKPFGVFAIFLFVLSGCADTEDEKYVEEPVELLYNKALFHMKQKEYVSAANAFDEVERQHPYSVWATKAHLMSAYAHYLSNKYDDAIIALDRFIQLHPSNRDTPYAFYLKALSYYEQITDVGRDQRMTELAMQTMKELIARFPKSKYARDALLKVDLTRDHLAGKEMEIGRYYERKGQYLAAINRFSVVTKKYQSTTHVPEALHRLTESYLALGLKDQARRTAAILGHNFPGSEWYMDAYKIVKIEQNDPANDSGKYQSNNPRKFPEGKKPEISKAPWYWPFD